MENNIISKKSQAELITTVLLILIAIAAVVLVSSFVINMVRNNLKGTECFSATGQIEIRADNSLTYFNSTDTMLYVNIERGTKDFNLSGIGVVYGNDYSSKKIQLKSGVVNAGLYFYDLNGRWNNSAGMVMPDPGETKTYRINTSAFSKINATKVSISPIISNVPECEMADEKAISSFSS